MTDLNHSLHTADEAERAVLSGVLVGGRAAFASADDLDAADFRTAWLGHVWAACAQLFDAGATALDVVAVVDQLRKTGVLARIPGGPAAVSQLEGLVVGSSLVPVHARTVRERAALRRCALAARAILSDSAEPGATAESVRRRGVELLQQVYTGSETHVVDPWEALGEVFSDLENPDNSRGTPTGLAALDDMTGGFRPGQLWIVAARPSMGKTALALHMLATAANAGSPAGLLSMEMPAPQIYRRMVSARSQVWLPQKGRTYSPDEWRRLEEARGWLGELPFAVDDRAGQSLEQALSSIARLASDGARVIGVDYLTLIRMPGTERSSMAARVGEVSKALKRAAREHEIAVVCLAQLNRGVEQRQDKRPMMSDLRESGAIEEDADVIALLYREEYYLREKCPGELVGVAELGIAKNRNGETGRVLARWDGRHQLFGDLA